MDFEKAAEVGDMRQVNEHLKRVASMAFGPPPRVDPRVAALHKAAENRHVSVVEMIIRQCPSVLSHDVDELGRTLLHIAALTGQEDVVMLLSLEDRKRIQVNGKAAGGITALHLAAYCGHVAVVALLCCWEGVELAATSVEELTPLHMASVGGHGKIVRVLADACRIRNPSSLATFVNAQDCLGRTPLHYACAGGHADAAQELLALRDVNPSIPDKVMGLVPLHLAAWMGDHVEVVKLLMGVEALDPNVKFAPAENADVISNMLQKNAVPQDEKASVIASMLKAKDRLPGPRLEETLGRASFTWKDQLPVYVSKIEFFRGGGTALHLACQENHKAVAEVLLQHSKTEPNPRDSNGMAPIHYAAAMDHVEVLKTMLSESRVDLNVQVGTPRLKIGSHTLSQWALYFFRHSGGHSGLSLASYMSLLVDMVTAFTVDLNPQVRTSSAQGTERAVAYLLDGNERAFLLDTPLHLAVHMESVSAVKELCAHPRLRPNKINWGNRNAFHLASRREQWPYMSDSLEEIKNVLLTRPEVREYMDGLERAKERMKTSANALLVVSTLMAGLSFAGAIAPPTGILGDSVSRSTTDAVSTSPLARFLWFNHLTFYFSLCAGVVCLLSFTGGSFGNPCAERQVVLLTSLVTASTFMVLLAATCAGCAFLAAEEVHRGGTSPFSLHLPNFVPRMVGALTLAFLTLYGSMTLLADWLNLLRMSKIRWHVVKAYDDPLLLPAAAAAKYTTVWINTLHSTVGMAVGVVSLWVFIKMTGAW